ncbi:homoserine kinase [Chromohalobacter nigrandesensis]|uniref:homoserine kinase n=1 Tax=Chromohalobacter nigrandesensis TaxID=119863 RepID=UPI001FF45DB0|nr:homoserine kinase [Chromohalobacter nigrandesensis]MCK0745431.1 homoserine kinase [Chromohalobacter nigrandesensis]
MAVFTPLNETQVADFLERFDVGTLTTLEGVPSGTENSTFFVTTDQGRFVLTLFEQGESDELPFFVALLDYLDEHRLPVAGPVHDREGIALQDLAERPALLFPRLPGRHPESPTLAQCGVLGDVLGRMHKVSQRFEGQRPNPRDLHWLAMAQHKVMSYLSEADQRLMADEIDTYQIVFGDASNLPQGAIHGDLFRDNTLFEGERLSGIIDFYNGCTGDLLFDLAIVVNDWTSDANGDFDEARYTALLGAYQARRPLNETEQALWPVMLRMTALRYWLSRLLVIYVDPPAHDLTPKDPSQYRHLLLTRLEHGAPPLPPASPLPSTTL